MKRITGVLLLVLIEFAVYSQPQVSGSELIRSNQDSLNRIISDINKSISGLNTRIGKVAIDTVRTVLIDRINDVKAEVDNLNKFNTNLASTINTEFLEIQTDVIHPLFKEKEKYINLYEAAQDQNFNDLAALLSKDLVKSEELEGENEALKKDTATYAKRIKELTKVQKTYETEKNLLQRGYESGREIKQVVNIVC